MYDITKEYDLLQWKNSMLPHQQNEFCRERAGMAKELQDMCADNQVFSQHIQIVAITQARKGRLMARLQVTNKESFENKSG